MRVGNTQLTAGYMSTTWTNYVLRMTSGQTLSAEMQTPPKPPMGLILSPPNADGLVYATPGTTPVCPMPPLPTYNGGLTVTGGLIENQIDIGVQDGDSAFYSAGPNDTWPANKKTPSLPAGATYPAGTYQKFPAPVGSLNIKWPDGTVGVHGGWYEKVA